MGEMKRFAKKAVKELCIYQRTQGLIEPYCKKIDAATSVGQVNRIMHDLRNQL